MIEVLRNGWEEWHTLICPACRHRLYQPGSANAALEFLTNGGCGHPYPGDA